MAHRLGNAAPINAAPGGVSLIKIHKHPVAFAKLMRSDSAARSLCSESGAIKHPAIGKEEGSPRSSRTPKWPLSAASDVALGMMVPAPRLGGHSAAATAGEACLRDNDLVACAAASWLPQSLEVLLLHDCAPLCRAPTTSSCGPPPSTAGRNVHHAPYTHAPPRWAAGLPQLRRRCFYGPAWGSALGGSAGLRRAASNPSVHHDWAKSASLLLAMHDVFGESKRFLLKLDSDTVVEPRLLLQMLAALHDKAMADAEAAAAAAAAVTAQTLLATAQNESLFSRHSRQRLRADDPPWLLPALAFGNSKGLHQFKACPAPPPLQQCVSDPSSSRSLGHSQCLRGTTAWLAILNESANAIAGEAIDAAWEGWRGASAQGMSAQGMSAQGTSAERSAEEEGGGLPASIRTTARAKEARRLVASSLATPSVQYASGTLYGLTRTALTRLVRSGCMERLAGEITCVEAKGTPSTLLEDANIGLCAHLLAIQSVQCDCITHRAAGQHTDPLPTANFFRCAAPLSAHPVKQGEGYLAVARMLQQRGDRRLNLQTLT